MALSRIAAAIAGACLAAGALGGCGDPTVLDAVDRNAAFNPDTLDFGTRAIGERSQLPTTLRYVGGDTRQVRVVRFDPPHTAFAARQKDGGTLRGAFVSGSTPLDIEVLYDPPVPERDDTTMILEFDSTVAKLPITAEARAVNPPNAMLAPASILFQPAIEVGRDVMQLITVSNGGEAAGALDASSVGAPFTITEAGGHAITEQPIAPGTSRMLEVHFHPGAAGSFTDTIQLALGNGPPASLTVRGDAIAAGTLSCDPSSLVYGGVPRGTSRTENVHCTVSGGPYTLAGFALSPGNGIFTVPSPPATGTELTAFDLAVVFNAEGLPQPYTGSIDLTGASGAHTSIPLTGNVVPPGPASTDLTVSLSWSTDETDFDLHLVRDGSLPFTGGDDCYFEFKHLDWGTPGSEADDPFLDRDDRTGYGPEEINLAHASGTYDIYVQYFDYSTMSPPMTQAAITYWLHGVQAPRLMTTMTTCGNTWHAGTITFDAGGMATFAPAGEEVDTWKSRTRRCR